MIPLAEPDLSGNEARYLQECVTTGFVSSVGPFVARFEQMVAEAAGARAAFATASGTAGLHLALVAVGVMPGDLVIVPSFTFIATANAVAHCGATPWIFDVSPETWTLDAGLVARALAAETRREAGGCLHAATGRRVAAILPVHTLGLAADMDALGAVARDYGLRIVADAACALGILYRGKPVAHAAADLSVFSFNGNKTVTSGGGGAVVGLDPALVAFARHLGTTARNGPGYDHDRVGFNYRMTNLQAAVGCAQMERLSDLVAGKRRVRGFYDRAFAKIAKVTPFPGGNGPDNACWLSGIVATTPTAAEDLRQRLAGADLEAKPFWKPIHLQTPYRDAPRTPQPVSEGLWQRIVTLPSSSSLSDVALERIVATVEEALK